VAWSQGRATASAVIAIEEVKPMFEQNQAEVEALMQTDAEFRHLYRRHKELDNKVRDAELGVLPTDEATLRKMKFEKLYTKDKLTHLWESTHPASH
jgi:uncharacterized protein YdcH (DUF465 family)